jgi:hypothetical protein
METLHTLMHEQRDGFIPSRVALWDSRLMMSQRRQLTHLILRESMSEIRDCMIGLWSQADSVF